MTKSLKENEAQKLVLSANFLQRACFIEFLKIVPACRLPDGTQGRQGVIHSL